MTTIGEVLGGIVRDIAQVRVLADRLAEETAETYAQTPLLSVLPIPRLGIKEVSLKLRFVVDTVAEADFEKEAEVAERALWKKELAEVIAPRLLGEPADSVVATKLVAGLGRAALPKFALAAALKGDTAKLVRESTTFVTKNARLSGGHAAKLRAGLERELPNEIESLLNRFRDRIAASKRASLSVLVRKADLEKAAEQTIQELSVTLSLDDIELVGAGAKGGG